MPQDGWGAAMLYAGVDGHALPVDSPLHHQVILAEPLGEGNSVYMSLSPAWDSSRAPQDKRAVTFSTHTNLQKWWHLYDTDRPAYEHQKEKLTQKMIQAAELVLPGFSQAVELALPGTPVTFERFTRRKWGWVGGFPQTNLVRAWGPHIADGLWMVGDSIFPGQSTASVALGGLRVARAVLGRAPTKIKVIEPVGSESVRLGDGKVEHVNI